MKLLSRILVTLVALLGIAFLVMQSRAAAAGKKCEGNVRLTLGLDDNGCETKEPLHVTQAEMKKWLNKIGVGNECYKIRFWKEHNPDGEIGELEMVQCVSKEGTDAEKPKVLQPTGTGSTQHIWFNTSTAKEAFEKQMQAPEPKSTKK